MNEIRNARKFIFENGLFYIVLTEDNMIALVDESFQFPLEEFYVFMKADEIFDKTVRLLERLEARELSIANVRDTLRNFMDRELTRTSIDTLATTL